MSGTRRLGLLRGIPESGVEPIDTNYWFFDDNVAEYLILPNAGGASDFVSDEFTAALLLERTYAINSKSVYFCEDYTYWGIVPLGNENLRCQLDGLSYNTIDGAPAGLNLVANGFKYVDGSNDIQRGTGISTTYGTQSSDVVRAWGHLSAVTGDLQIARNGPSGVSTGGKYYAAMFFDELLTAAQLEDIWDKTLHPTDFASLRLLINFGQPVGATYTPEVGSYTFDVYGTPVLNGP